jgi:hypothetical protein
MQHFAISLPRKGARMRYGLLECITGILNSEMRSALSLFDYFVPVPKAIVGE